MENGVAAVVRRERNMSCCDLPGARRFKGFYKNAPGFGGEIDGVPWIFFFEGNLVI
jgi:hypothetical protein